MAEGGRRCPSIQTAHYQVKAAGVETVKAAIAEFVDYVKTNEPGTRMYFAWQQSDDPTRFVHLFTFEDEEAHKAHGSSDAVKRFEDVYRPAARRWSSRLHRLRHDRGQPTAVTPAPRTM